MKTRLRQKLLTYLLAAWFYSFGIDALAGADLQGAVAAQTPTVSVVLKASTNSRKEIELRPAVNAALRNNPLIASASSGRKASTYAREAAEWLRYPKFSANFTPNLVSSNSVGAGASLSLEQPLWAGGRIDGQIAGAKSQERAAGYSEVETQRKIIEQTSIAYIALMRSEERLQVAENGIAMLGELVGYVERRRDAGAASNADVQFAYSRLGQMQVQKEQLRGESERSKSEFQAVTVTDFDRAVPIDLPAYSVADKSDMESVYLENSLVVSQRKAEIEAVMANLDVRKASVFPTVSLRAERVRSPLFDGGTFEDTRLGLTMQYVPDAGLASLSLIQEAESRLEAARSELQRSEVEIKASAKNALADFLTASNQIEALDQQANALENSSKSFLRQFESGRKTWVDVLNINRELIDAQLSLSRARTLREQSQIRLMINSGKFSSWLEKQPL